MFDDLPNTRRITEDSLVFSQTYEEHVGLVKSLFERVAANNVALNTTKFMFAHPSAVFGGYVVDANGFDWILNSQQPSDFMRQRTSLISGLSSAFVSRSEDSLTSFPNR